MSKAANVVTMDRRVTTGIYDSRDELARTVRAVRALMPSLSMECIGQAAGVSTPTVHRILNGK